MKQFKDFITAILSLTFILYVIGTIISLELSPVKWMLMDDTIIWGIIRVVILLIILIISYYYAKVDDSE